MTRARGRLTSTAAVGAIAVGLVACGGDDDDDAATTDTPAATAAPAGTQAPAGTADGGSMPAGHQMITVEGVDYAFENLPASVPAGTMLGFHNSSEAEFHEMVVTPIPDEETRPVTELVTLPEDEINAIFGETEPAAALVAGPGEDGIAVFGDGTVTEPGRYAVVCFIPVGADPAAVAAAMQSPTSEPTDLGDGPPHASAGMVAEFEVTDA